MKTFKYSLVVIVLLTAIISCNKKNIPANTPISNKIIYNKQNQAVLLGHCSISALQQDPFSNWFFKQQQNFALDTSVVKNIEPLLQHKTIEIFLGSWCGDSKREVPRMLKLLEMAKIDTTNIRLIFVDNDEKRYKQSPEREEIGKNIHHVPTFIVYHKQKEIGRIVETPIESLEKDLLSILKKENYQPNYKAIQYWQTTVKNKNKAKSLATLQQVASKLKPLCKHSGELNSYGYVLLAEKKLIEAIDIFTVNTLIYDTNDNCFDSLGEAYFTIGNTDKAKQNFQKALRLNPKNTHAKEMLAQIK